MAALGAQIKLQQQAKLAEQPGSVRASKAENDVKRCKSKMERAEKRLAEMQEKLADVQKQVSEHEQKEESARTELRQAESWRDDVYRSLQAAPPSSAPAGPAKPGAFDGALAAHSLLPQEALEELGISREKLGDLLQGLAEAFGSWQSDRAAEAAAEAQRLAEETAAATAQQLAADTAAAAKSRAATAAKEHPVAEAPKLSAQELSELERQSAAAKRASDAATERLEQAKKAKSTAGSSEG